MQSTTDPAFTFVFHPVGGVADAQSRAFIEAARVLLQGMPTGEVLLVSPYLGYDIVSPLVEERRFRLITDLEACCEAESGDRLQRFLSGNLDSIRHIPGVHAKVILTEGGVLFGSANLTRRGFTSRDELGCLIMDPSLVAPVRDWFERLWCVGEPADASRIASAGERGRALAAARAAAASTGVRTSRRTRVAGRSLGWMQPGRSVAPPAGRSLRHDASDQDHTQWGAERDELAAQLRTLTNSRAECESVLGLLARALEIAALPVDDDRLHLNFGNTAINVTINQRYVAWCDGQRGKEHFGFILSEWELAQRAARDLDGASVFHFRRGGLDDVPALVLPLRYLGDVPQTVFGSWERAIRGEIGRTRLDGTPYTSSFLRHKRPFLYHALTDPALRREIADRASVPRCWWFGVNNGPGGHIQLSQIRGLLAGEQSESIWHIGRSRPKSVYEEMRSGDRVLVWTGHGADPRWGLLGTAAITAVAREHVVLADAREFRPALTPYPKGQPEETEEVWFLRHTFGEDFTPLGDVMRAVFGTRRTTPITVSPVADTAFEAVIERASRSGRPRFPEG